MNKKPLMLMILDGWGINKHNNEVNAIKEARPLELEEFIKNYPYSELEASGEAVGLPEGQMGNSEVGHLNIGAGRVVYQPLVEITKDIREGTFYEKPILVEAYTKAKNQGKNLHLAGLLSDGGVHSHSDHLYALLKMAKKYEIKNVYVHCFLDGRDTPPQSGIKFVKELEEKIKEIGVGKIATLSGRYFSMDRDKNWDRTEKGYRLMVEGLGNGELSPITAIEKSYAKGITDEFLEPTLIEKDGLVKEGDVFINFNYRPDRARQITRALNDKEFSGFSRNWLKLSYYSMRQYDVTIDAPFIYVDKELTNTLGEVLSKNGLSQLRTAETEKYAHVTFFFNGGKEEAFKGETRLLVDSPKVATYNLKPEMAAYELTEKTIDVLEKGEEDVIIINYANPDMVGHTGVLSAAVKAIKTVDECATKVIKKVLEKDGVVLVTADHGNAELMIDPVTNTPFTAHTTNKVPFILISNDEKLKKAKLKDGKLADIAPTILEILQIEKPCEMDGETLLDI